jgi:hypothetical protein
MRTSILLIELLIPAIGFLPVGLTIKRPDSLLNATYTNAPDATNLAAALAHDKTKFVTTYYIFFRTM